MGDFIFRCRILTFAFLKAKIIESSIIVPEKYLLKAFPTVNLNPERICISTDVRITDLSVYMEFLSGTEASLEIAIWYLGFDWR